MLSRSDLHGYQHRAAAFVREHRSAALWVDLGLGKTAIVLTAVAGLMDDLEVRNALVVAPLRVAQQVWTDEIRKWAHVRHLRAAIMVGSRDERTYALRQKADLHIINVDNLRWLEDTLAGHRLGFPWDMIVIDESSMFKNQDTTRFRVMRRMSRKAKRVVELTATPSPNGYHEIWPQFYLLDGGQRLGLTISGFRERYFRIVAADDRGPVLGLKKGAERAIHGKIADITLTLKAEDYLDMPEKIDLYHKIRLEPEEKATYDKFERQAVLTINDREIDAVSAAALATKLLQLANGQVYDDEKNVHSFHGRKLDRLREIVDEAGGESVLVAYSYRSDLKRILAAFPQAVALEKDPKTIERWNRGEIKMLVAHPASAGHGLNLQFGGRTIVWYGLTWSLELYLQFIGRLHRQGQAKPVRVHHLIAVETIDEDVVAVLARKDKSQRGLLEAMKKRFASRFATDQHSCDNPTRVGLVRRGGGHEIHVRESTQTGV